MRRTNNDMFGQLEELTVENEQLKEENKRLREEKRWLRIENTRLTQRLETLEATNPAPLPLPAHPHRLWFFRNQRIHRLSLLFPVL